MLHKVELALRPEEAAGGSGIKSALAAKVQCNPEDITAFRLVRRTIDARSKQVKIRLFFDVYTGEHPPLPQNFERSFQNVGNAQPVVIAGLGPAGIFAAIRLIELGYKPVIIERGKDVRARRRDLAAINREGIVDPDSNYCFGEGGAGTYSDGKLYTRSDKRGNIPRILSTFTEFGAEQDILIDAHPHIGTNKLPGIVTAMRNRINECGGEILFNTRLTGIHHETGKLKKVELTDVINGNKTLINSTVLILATGHSARDIFRMLHQQGILIEAKPFAMGVRAEHPQELIDRMQYHSDERGPFLPPASYSLTTQADNRGVYSFCMCPGGIIAPAATAPGEIVVNGWSPSKRNNPFANSGIVVSVTEKDLIKYNKAGALSAMELQKDTEQLCFTAGGGKLKAPAQRMADFCNNKFSTGIMETSYLPGVNSAMLKDILPTEITAALKKAFKDFGNKMKGYYSNEAILVATESRTSSPVRIPRDSTTLMHPEVKGLFPCAEGAGYAGGIVSAAMDGERCAEAVVNYLSMNQTAQ